MRLWHKELIEYLPKSQLLSQWRELNSIYTKEDKHILINYIYNYQKEYLLDYSNKVIDEMKARGINIKKWDNYKKYFRDIKLEKNKIYDLKEHDIRYLKQCYFNLQEKFDRGQKDFNVAMYSNLTEYVQQKINDEGNKK